MKTLSIILTLLLSISAAHAERKALVIGNADYSNISQLQNSVNDAEDIADKLKSLNFDVTIKKNQTHKQMKASVRKFSQKVSSGDVALFYYAGHGVQSSNLQNYLIPLSADIQDEADLNYQAINANWVLSNLKQASPSLKIMVLDACRDNPFRSFRSWRGSDSRGLARMESSSGTIIAYAAGAGEKANDGSGRNGLFTEELLKWLGKSGIEAGQMFTKVSWKVSSNSQGKGQSPFLSIQAPPPFCFAGCDKPQPETTVLVQAPAQSKPKPAVSTRSPYEPDMAFIQGGTYKMGCVSGKNCQSDENVHSVSVDDFWIGKYEVTFNEWENCVNDGGCQSNKKPDDEGWGRGKHPVINVSWHDANEYAKWLSKKTGKNYHLPTEAEWEYAARAGSKTKYYFGNNEVELCKYGNHADKSVDYSWRNEKCSDGVGKKTAKVGSYQVNNFGLHDTIGNVWEWTCSAYPKADDYDGSETKCTNKNDTRSRVLRGGSWGSEPRYVRSANRPWNTATNRANFVGFRLSRTR